ncbi:hypothetical protein [Ralstonia sp. 24A2]|uniref:hypothetical protein n=1 Tax=Ralstonia sp. 24A2 TaxID=3447364 RepID=UPI003F694E19
MQRTMCEFDAIAMVNMADAEHARAAIRVPRIRCAIVVMVMCVEMDRIDASAWRSARDDATTSPHMSMNARADTSTHAACTEAPSQRRTHASAHRRSRENPVQQRLKTARNRV